MVYFTSRIDNITPDIKNANDLELIKLQPGKEFNKNNFIFYMFANNKLKKIKRNGAHIDYYIFPNKIQFKKFCKKIEDMDSFYSKTFNLKPVYFFTDMLGIDEYKTKKLFYNYKNILYILKFLKNTLNYDICIYKTIFSKAINDAQKENIKKYKLKNEIDSFFGFLNNNAYKDVFAFKEMRKNRKIFVLDINSMYPYLLTLKRYTIPYKLKKIKINSIEELNKYPFFVIKAGVKIKKDISEKDKQFISEFHSIECRINNYTVPVKLSETDELCTYFLKEEYDFYKKFLDFSLKDDYVIVCEEISYSPLKKIIEKVYPLRLQAKEKKKEDDRYEVIDSVLKNYLVALPSSFSQNSSVMFDKYFKNEEKFKEFIRKKLGWNIREDEIMSKPLSILYKKYEKIGKDKILHVKYKAFSYRFKDNLIHHHSIMFANARILMMNYFYNLFKVKEKYDLEILYSNIDSIHVSVDADKAEKFELFLKENNLIGKELGKLKIEEKADYGLWFEVGSYYLFDKNYQVVKFANPLPKSKKKPFQIVCAVKDYDEFGYEFFRKYSLFKSFRYIKELKNSYTEDFVKFKRTDFNTGCIYENLQNYIKNNLIKLYPVFKEVFYELKQKNINGEKKH